MKIKITNDRVADEDKLYLLLTGGSPVGVKGIDFNKSVKFSDFKAKTPSMEIEVGSIEAARLYIGYGEFAGAPLPDGKQYYGWIEFTKKVNENQIWINLSNVDLTGLPLALAGTDTASKPFTLGYKKSIKDIIALMKTGALVPASDSNAAYITCDSGQVKIVGPNGMPDSYGSYDKYISDLCKAKAPLVITSDTPDGGSSKTFTGSFLNAQKGDDPIISLKSESGDTLVVLKSQFTTEICYRCDGGKLIYNKKTVNQNQSPQNTNDKMYSNSTFRNILIGINEGYFTTKGPNISQAFPGDIPFSGGEGSKYAKILHENSNSYGFPYADSNLKVLITSDPSKDLNLTICKDDVAKGYDGDTNKTANQPSSGEYSFGIGSGSSSLGLITIGNWRYTANDVGAYGGFLPNLPNWTQRHFSGPDKYIWIKTTDNGHVEVGDGFNPAPAFASKLLSWGAKISWVSGKASPAKPTT